jgi:hypothetical protein
MTTGASCRLCSRSLERNEPRTLAPGALTTRIPGLGIKIHKSCYLGDLGVADEEEDGASSADLTEPKAPVMSEQPVRMVLPDTTRSIILQQDQWVSSRSWRCSVRFDRVCEAIRLEANELREDTGLLRAEARRLRDESRCALGRSTTARETRCRIRAARRKS